MKKALIIFCALAILLLAVGCKKNNNDPKDNDTTTKKEENKISDIVNQESKDTEKDVPSDTSEKEEKEESDVISEIQDTTTNNIQGSVSYVNGDDDPDEIFDDTLPEPEIISNGGTEPGLWPDELPDEVPEYSVYSKMYQATYEKYDNSEVWYLCFDSTEKALDEWLTKLKDTGFIESKSIVGYWGKGTTLIDMFTETDENGTFFVSIDVFKTDVPAVPAEFPAFTTDCTLYDWTEEDGKLTVKYVCGTDFTADADAYLTTLKNAGYTVNGQSATLNKNSKTYTCTVLDNSSAHFTLEYTVA